MDTKIFYADLKLKIEELVEGLEQKRFGGQPEDGTLYIVSKKVRQSGITPGSISLAPVRLAAMRIVEGSHELASAAEILAYEQRASTTAKEIRRKEIGRKQQFVVHMRPEEVEEKQLPASVSSPLKGNK